MIQRTWFPRINQRAPLANGLVFAGLGGGASSLMYADSSPFGRNGTLVNGPTWGFDATLGRWGVTCATDDYVALPWWIPTPSASVGLWFNDSDVTSECRLFANGNTSGNTLTIQVQSSSVRGIVNTDDSSGQVVGTETAISSSTLYHVVLTFNGSRLKLYLNGRLSTDNAAATSFGSTLARTYFGARYSSSVGITSFFPGKMYDTLVASRIWSDAEIQQLADPSNTMLSGLILPPRRVLWPVTAAAPVTTFKPMQFQVC